MQTSQTAASAATSQNRQTPGVIEFSRPQLHQNFPAEIWACAPRSAVVLEMRTQQDVRILVGCAKEDEPARAGIIIKKLDTTHVIGSYCPVYRRDWRAMYRGMLLADALSVLTVQTAFRCYGAAEGNTDCRQELHRLLGDQFDEIMATTPPNLEVVLARYREMGVDLTPKPLIRPDIARLYARA